MSGTDSDRVGTFVFPPNTFENVHPIRVFQMDHCTSSCPRDYFLIMGCMQLSDQAILDSTQAAKELQSIMLFIAKYFDFTHATDTTECELKMPHISHLDSLDDKTT